MSEIKLTLFYDDTCPLCVAEMTQLRQADHRNRIELIALGRDGVSERFPDLDQSKAMAILHGKLKDAEGNERWVLGLDATYWAWRLVGQKPWVAILRWPLVKWFADLCYRLFAKHRYRFSFLLTGSAKLDPMACRDGKCKVDER